MNLRISKGQLRLRISREELARLREDKALELILPLDRHRFCYRLSLHDEPIPLAVREENDALMVSVNRQALEDLIKQLPSRDGIEHEVMAGGAALLVILEVDVRPSSKAA